jgi:CBS domain-containing protein
MGEVEHFLKAIHPFDELTKKQLKEVANSTEIGYYKSGSLVITPQNFGKHFFIVIKGKVVEKRDDNVVAIYGEGESFDANSLLYSECENSFTVEEELLCYEIPKDNFTSLIESSEAFKNYFVENLATKIQGLKERERGGALSSFMLAKVSDIFLHSATIVKSDTSIIEAIKLKEENRSSCILVTSPDKNLSIVTDTNIRKDLILSNRSLNDSVIDIAVSPIEGIDFNDFLFNAMIKLVRHNIKRLIVWRDGVVVGVLEQIDILSHFSNHSYLVAVQIEKAKTVKELKEVSNGIVSLIQALFERGVKVRHSTKLISELNRKIYKKLFQLIFSEELQKVATLYIMGSEGRREQILKTDQDNGILLHDEKYRDEVVRVGKEFTETLLSLGYPKCDGDIMVSNPYWIETEEGLKKRVSGFIDKPDPSALMELAILFDGEVVVGDSKALNRVKIHITQEVNRNRFALDSFASAVEIFETPLSLFFTNFIVDRGHGGELDIKKGGIFATVHGVRSLALEKGILETNTIERIKELNNMGVINRELATELIEAFDTLLSLRLSGRLKKVERGDPLDNYINPESLSSLQRDMLKDSFKIVNRFKKFLSYHFKLDRIG